MRKPIVAVAAAFVLAVGLSACSTPASTEPASSPDNMSESAAPESDKMSDSALTGDFMGAGEKKVEGKVSIEGSTLTLSHFASDEGPDLYVYLANGTDEAAVSAGMRIDKVSFDTASQTFTLDGVDTSDYKYVVIHCDKANAVFGSAALS